MDRLACLELHDFQLQLVLRDHANWRGEPVAVLERDLPHARLLWVNATARAAGLLSGQRYSAALGVCAGLKAAVLTPEDLQRKVAEVLAQLQRFSPQVEPCAEEPGVFWLGARGLQRLFGAPREWAAAILEHMRRCGFEGRVAVGFRHFAVYAAVKAVGRAPIAVFDDPRHEAEVASRLSLARLPIEPRARDALAKLAIRDLGQFAKLPADGILQRFGAGVHRLHRMAAGAFDDPLRVAPEQVPFAAHFDLDYPDASIDSLLIGVEGLLRPLCRQLERGGEAASELRLGLGLDDGSRVDERVAPARATCDVDWLLRLLRMRLQGRELPSAALRLEVELTRVPAHAGQATLFEAPGARGPSAAAKAFAALRASFGDDAVVRARPASAHLPEHGFSWERCLQLPAAAPRCVPMPPLVRRMLEVPQALPSLQGGPGAAWRPHGPKRGRVIALRGPYRLNGGWWRSVVQRDYHFAELSDGEIAWIFYDVARRGWFLQGRVS